MSLFQPIKPHVCWSVDYISDALRLGHKFRTFNVIDDYNRHALGIKVRSSLTAACVTEYLDCLALQHAYSDKIRVDNASEFISSHFRA